MLKLRDRESNALVVAKEIDVLKDRIAELENIRNTLQLDLDNAVNFHCFFCTLVIQKIFSYTLLSIYKFFSM